MSNLNKGGKFEIQYGFICPECAEDVESENQAQYIDDKSWCGDCADGVENAKKVS